MLPSNTNASKGAYAALSRARHQAEELAEKLGRPLRVLHVGNIANNAYLAAKAERQIGIESFVASPNYLHVMGFPSWEESCDVVSNGRHYSGDINSTLAPKWFLSGTWEEIFQGLVSSEEGLIGSLNTHYKLGTRLRFTHPSKLIDSAYSKVREPLLSILGKSFQDQLSNSMLFLLRSRLSRKWTNQLVSHFDILNAYGPYNAFFADRSRLVSTEHGTLRDFIWSPTFMSRVSRRAYTESQAILVTNQDNLEVANQIVNATHTAVAAVPHPTNPEPPEGALAQLPENLQQLLRSPGTVIVAPARHSTPSSTDRGKGSQYLYQVIRRCSEENLPVTFVLVEWGDNAEKVRGALCDLEHRGFVNWTPLLSRPLLACLINEADAVIDQFTIPAYGAIGLDTLRGGTRLLTRSDPNLDTAFFGAPAPVDNVGNDDDALTVIRNLCAQPNTREPVVTMVNWFDDRASWGISLLRRVEVYTTLMAG